MNGPLDGVKVIDLSTIVSGPLAGSLLGDQGADVIKIESPLRPDNARFMGPIRGESGALFAAANRSKRSLALDLKKDGAKEIIYQLIKNSDVIIDNFRPGILKKLGLEYEDVKKHNPKIIQLSITGYGVDGPYSKRRVYDPLIQATAGMADAQSIDGNPKFVKTLMCDKITSLTAAQSVTAALYAREKTNEGQKINLSMLDTALYFMWSDNMYNFTWLGDGWEPIPNIADFYEPVKTKDGYIALVAINDSEFAGVCRAIDREDLLTDERFSTMQNRMMNVMEMQKILLHSYTLFTSEELVDRMDKNDVPSAIINKLGDVIDDPQVQNNDSVKTLSKDDDNSMQSPRSPAQYSSTPCADNPKFMPDLGEHSKEILLENGFSDEKINDLAENQIIAVR
jgi:crotonobetainyl-CoA:carnitine CoA-transferase CaiB-like acyl-CoA transferase